jgi:DNA-binding NarL/FixJ family response regulator
MARAKSGRQRGGADSKKRILIVDDHPVVRQGLMRLINEEDDLEVCGEAENSQQALGMLSSCKPDVAVLDLSLGSESGLELIKAIHARASGLPIIVLSMHDESIYAERALRAGASGYVMKHEDFDSILGGIRHVLKGEICVSDRIAKRIINSYVKGGAESDGSPADALTDRELEVFTLMGRGMATRQIAEALHLSAKTVETYREKIKAKLGLSNAVELMQHAFAWVQQVDEANL